MRVIVSDASVLFDLADADLLLRCFELPYEFQIADVMFEEELVSIGAMREQLAAREGGILLTGDRRLRNAAATEGVERHGHLWLIERLSENGVVADGVLVDVLASWKDDVRVRLPNEAVDQTVKRLQG